MIQIFDNFLPEQEFKEIQHFMSNMHFPWFMGKVLPDEFSECDDIDNYQLMHIFYAPPTDMSPYLETLKPLIKKMRIYALVRVKANLNPRTPQPITHGMHLDVPPEHAKKIYTAIYYLNTNNGATVFEDGTRIDCVENRLVVFDADNMHSGITCTDQKYKMLININFLGLLSPQ